jgi:uncharacterized protein YktA (UPF0223 family)
MKPVKSKKFSEPIVFYSKQKNSTVVAVDKKTSVRFLDQQTLETLGGFKANIDHRWYTNQVVSFSPHGDYFVTISEDLSESRLYDAKTKKIRHKVSRHKGEVSCVALDPSGKYFFSAGEDGRTFVIGTKTKRLLFTLPHHADTINDIKFSKKSFMVATASYDKKIKVFNYATITPVAVLKAHRDPVMKVEFLSLNRLCSVDKASSAIVWDISAQKVIKRLEGIHDDIIQITSSEKFIFLGTALGFVMVYDAQTYEQLSRKFIDVNAKITSLIYDEEQDLLVVGDELGNLSYFDVFFGLEKLQKHVVIGDYDKAYALFEKNPLLAYTEEFQKIERIWHNIYTSAMGLLQESKKEKALKLFGKFKDIPSKNSQIKKLFKEFEEYDKFLLMVKNGKIAIAYSLANQYPLFKDSKVYEALEKKWRKLFGLAQKMAMESRPKEQIKELLSEYRGISEKTKHIQEMLIKSEVYNRFKNSIIKKEFKIVFELIKVNPFLKEFPEYASLINFADSLYIKANKALEGDDVLKALKLLNVLIDFPDFKDEVMTIKEEIDTRDRFYRVIQKSDLAEIYSMIDNSISLVNTPEGKKYNTLWYDDLELAKDYALNGDVQGVDTILQKYKNVESKYISIANVYSLSYITQIETAIKKKMDQKDIETAFKSYILYFGLDDHIISTYELFKRIYVGSNIDFDSLKKGSKNLWRQSMRVMDILE